MFAVRSYQVHISQAEAENRKMCRAEIFFPANKKLLIIYITENEINIFLFSH